MIMSTIHKKGKSKVDSCHNKIIWSYHWSYQKRKSREAIESRCASMKICFKCLQFQSTKWEINDWLTRYHDDMLTINVEILKSFT